MNPSYPGGSSGNLGGAEGFDNLHARIYRAYPVGAYRKGNIDVGPGFVHDHNEVFHLRQGGLDEELMPPVEGSEFADRESNGVHASNVAKAPPFRQAERALPLSRGQDIGTRKESTTFTPPMRMG